MRILTEAFGIGLEAVGRSVNLPSELLRQSDLSLIEDHLSNSNCAVCEMVSDDVRCKSFVPIQAGP